MLSNSNNSSIKRFRDFGFNTGLLPIGKKNLISDVTGLQVGHLTKSDGENTRTGITVIDPGLNNLYAQKLPAAIVVGNGYGKLAGITQVEELGTLETPIALTNTLAVGPVVRGVVDLALSREKLPKNVTINAVVGEVNDGWVNDIHENAIKSEDVQAAARNSSTDFELGSVGAGTGTRSFSWKGGIGSSSRVVKVDGQKYTVGVLVQTNFGGSLTIMGVPIGQILGKDDFDFARQKGPDGSCMIVVATDAPFSARQLKRIASRALLGMVRTGSIMANTSGDYAVAFSTSRVGLETVPGQGLSDDWLNPFFLAAVEAVEESIYDALFTATPVSSKVGKLDKLPVDEVVKILRSKL